MSKLKKVTETNGKSLQQQTKSEEINVVYSSEVEMISVKDTPFHAVREGEDWFVVMGNYRITENLESKEKAIEECRTITWNRLIQVIGIMLNIKQKENE